MHRYHKNLLWNLFLNGWIFILQLKLLRAKFAQTIVLGYLIILCFACRYDKSPDFTVVLQPFIKLFNAPNADPRRAPPIDPSLVTYDCFHFSQKGHALGRNINDT